MTANQRRRHWTTLFMTLGKSRNAANSSGFGEIGDHGELKGVGAVLFCFLVRTEAWWGGGEPWEAVMVGRT
jgi:hypothetical protein